VHQRLVPFVDLERTILWPVAALIRLCDRYIPDERRRCSQPLVFDLVAHRARNSIRRRLVPLGKLLKRKAGKQLGVASGISVCHSHRWHMANRALILNRLR
jgi:hypothetical protein